MAAIVAVEATGTYNRPVFTVGTTDAATGINDWQTAEISLTFSAPVGFGSFVAVLEGSATPGTTTGIPYLRGDLPQPAQQGDGQIITLRTVLEGIENNV